MMPMFANTGECIIPATSKFSQNRLFMPFPDDQEKSRQALSLNLFSTKFVV
jgi:hypothetical protein